MEAEVIGGGGGSAFRKIAILGNAAGGKSRLAVALSERLGLHYHSVDKALWNPGWQPVAPSDFARLHGAWLAERDWVIDGWGDMALIEQRLAQADAVVLVDYALWRHCFWALKRQCMGIFRERSDGPAGCRLLPRSWELVKVLRWIHLYGLPELKGRIRLLCEPEKVFHIRSPRELGVVARVLAPP
jgi:adenylate kinase family enzyme